MASSTSRPSAAVWQKDVMHKSDNADSHGNRIIEHIRTDTYRGAMCKEHDRYVSDFRGVCADGWIFHCRGSKQNPDTAHSFIATIPGSN